MARQEEFRLGAVSHQHMLGMAHNEKMNELHQTHFNLASSLGRNMSQSWRNSDAALKQTAAHMRTKVVTKKETLSGPKPWQNEKYG